MSAARKKVLIVEDEYVLYEELEEFFTEKGFEVIGHPDGRAVDTYDDAVKLLELHAPHLAILDINLKGDKDGLELAEYIREHFFTLIVMLTGNGNYLNLERARMIKAEGFVLKADKPVNKDQLWATVVLELDKHQVIVVEKSRGKLFKVREVKLETHTVKNQQGFKQPVDPVDIETFFKWETITFIESANAKKGLGNNNILIHTAPNGKVYISRGTLSDIADKLPDNFVRIDQSFILNAHHITGRGRGSFLYFIGEDSFKISETYRDQALPKINMILGRNN